MELTLEGSLRHLEAEIRFRYHQAGRREFRKRNRGAGTTIEVRVRRGQGKAVLRGEEAVVRFFATGLPKLKAKLAGARRASASSMSLGTLCASSRNSPSGNEATAGWIFTCTTTAGKDAVIFLRGL